MKNIKKPNFSVDKEKMRENIRRSVILFIVAVFIVGGIGIYLFAIIANDDSTNTADLQDDTTTVEEQINPSLIVEGDVTKLKKEDIKKGDGATVKEGDLVKVKYTGALAESGVIFDSTEGDSLEIGLDQVIEGWKKGIPGMKVGGKRKLIIPSDMGYGASGNQTIPPNSDLVFEVEVIDIVKN